MANPYPYNNAKFLAFTINYMSKKMLVRNFLNK